MWPNPQETADLVIFTEEIFNGKLHFLCSDYWLSFHAFILFQTLKGIAPQNMLLQRTVGVKFPVMGAQKSRWMLKNQDKLQIEESLLNIITRFTSCGQELFLKKLLLKTERNSRKRSLKYLIVKKVPHMSLLDCSIRKIFNYSYFQEYLWVFGLAD